MGPPNPTVGTYVDTETATFELTLVAASCDEVTPAAPTVTQAVCRNGAFEPPTVTLRRLTGITYTKDKTDPYLPLPQVVTVTATLDDAGLVGPHVAARGGPRPPDDGDVPGAFAGRAVFPGASDGSGGDPGDVYRW